MNKEELIGKLQKVYVGDKNALNELIGYYDGLKQGIEELQQENEKLKADYGTKVQVERDLLKEENQSLKRQLNYLRSGEYYNQLRFERDMLQDLVDNGEVSKEDKEFIDMIHRNTELLEENQKLKDRDLIIAAELTKLQDENIRLKKESQKQKEVIDKAIEFSNKNWGTWCTHHLEYMTELQNILNEGKK